MQEFAVGDFPTIKKIVTGPTRGRKKLDIIYTDINNVNSTLLAPLESEDGIPSDHKIILCESDIGRKEENKEGLIVD